jgi:hypothetical protein
VNEQAKEQAMPSAKELRQSITSSREALIAAIEAASGRWEEGGDSSPKALAMTALKAEVEQASKAAAILGGNPLSAQDWALANAGEATEALKKIGPEVDKRFSWAEDRDLSKGQGGMTLEQIMQTHANTLETTAGQLRG